MNSEENDFTTNQGNNNLQNNVGSFANHNNKEDVEQIKGRINSSKSSMLNKNGSNENLVNNTSNGTEGLPEKESNKIDSKGEKKSFKDGLKSIGKNTATQMGRSTLNKATDEDGESIRLGDKAFGAVEKGKQTFDFIKKVKEAGSIIKFITTLGLGAKVALFAGVGLVLMSLFIILMSGVPTSSWGLKYGINDDDSYSIFDTEYDEGMNNNQVDEIYDSSSNETSTKNKTLDYICKRSLFTKIRNLLNSYDLSDICQLSTYVRKKIDSIQKDVENVMSPGLVLSTLYYAYDTQLVDENGNTYLDDLKAEVETDEDTDVYGDFDYITMLFENDVYTREQMDEVFENNVAYMNHYNYFEEVITYVTDADGNPMYDANGNVLKNSTCEPRTIKNYVDDDKLYIYLRYGKEVSLEYEKVNNYLEAERRTDDYCIDVFESSTSDVPNDLDLDRFDAKTTTEEISKDIVSVTVNGKEYTYEDGFIHTYPRFNSDITGIEESFSYMQQYEIEKIIEQLDSRVDYINYFLGYDTDLFSSISYSSGMVCTYSVNGNNYSNIKVKLIHSEHANLIGVDLTGDIEGQELIDFETYVAGVVYAEAGGSNDIDLYKAYAIAIRNYTLKNGEKSTDSSGNTIISIENSTFKQTYCDPYKGCTRYYGSNERNVFLYTAGTEPTGITYKSASNGALSTDSAIFTAVSETSGVILTDSSGNLVGTYYNNLVNSKWLEGIAEGKDYVELLMDEYKDKNPQISNNECTYGASGSWDSWRQYDTEWSNIMLYSKTFGSVGCFITAHTKAIAKSGAAVKLNPFNPGTVAQALKDSGEFKSGNGTSSTAIFRVSLVNGVKDSKNEWFTHMSKNQKINTISNLLSQGYEVVLRVKNNGRFGEEHWVLVTGTGPNEIYMSDPASDSKEVFAKYAPLDSDNYNICQYLAYKFY